MSVRIWDGIYMHMHMYMCMHMDMYTSCLGALWWVRCSESYKLDQRGE